MTVGLLRSCTIPVFPHLHLALVFPPLLAFRSDQITAELARSCTIRLQLIGRDRTHLPGVNTSPIATRNAFAAASASRSYASELRQVFANGMAPLIAPLHCKIRRASLKRPPPGSFTFAAIIPITSAGSAENPTPSATSSAGVQSTKSCQPLVRSLTHSAAPEAGEHDEGSAQPATGRGLRVVTKSATKSWRQCSHGGPGGGWSSCATSVASSAPQRASSAPVGWSSPSQASRCTA
ncbi:MAG: hypothetical protein QOJ58_5113 [Alphaproteobacteria bacterium]|nr:hypothetical protein [Alphaproteobacteria bacterium]